MPADSVPCLSSVKTGEEMSLEKEGQASFSPFEGGGAGKEEERRGWPGRGGSCVYSSQGRNLGRKKYERERLTKFQG